MRVFDVLHQRERHQRPKRPPWEANSAGGESNQIYFPSIELAELNHSTGFHWISLPTLTLSRLLHVANSQTDRQFGKSIWLKETIGFIVPNRLDWNGTLLMADLCELMLIWFIVERTIILNYWCVLLFAIGSSNNQLSVIKLIVSRWETAC